MTLVPVLVGSPCARDLPDVMVERMSPVNVCTISESGEPWRWPIMY
jgi:hypothetical protein